MTRISLEPLQLKLFSWLGSYTCSPFADREKAFAYLVRAVMKLTRGKASPQVVGDLLRKKIG